MWSRFDSHWAVAVSNVCDVVFEAADVGFVRQVMSDPDTKAITSLLWEADARRFAARYPDSEIDDSYGPEQWPHVHCIDYWVEVEGDYDRALISVEGWAVDDVFVPLTGDGSIDGVAIGVVMARILGVPPPQP